MIFTYKTSLYLKSVTALSLALTPISALAQSGIGIIAQAESRTFSDSFTLDGFLNGLEGAPYSSGGQGAFTHNQARLGASFSPAAWSKARFSAGLTARYDYAAQYSSDVADFVYFDQNSLDIADGDYAISLNLEETQARGLWGELSYDMTPNFSAYGRLSYLQTDQLTQGMANGAARFDDTDLQSLSLVLVDYFHTDPLFGEDVIAAKGEGYALDIGAAWKVNDKLSLRFDIEDAASTIKWEDVPQIEVDATTDTVSFNDDGTLNPRSSVEGIRTLRDNPETYKSELTTSYGARSTLAADYHLNEKWSLSQDVFNINDIWLAHSAARYHLSESLSLGTQFEWTSGAIGGFVNWHGLEASLTTDSLEFEQARYLDLKLHFVHQF